MYFVAPSLPWNWESLKDSWPKSKELATLKLLSELPNLLSFFASTQCVLALVYFQPLILPLLANVEIFWQIPTGSLFNPDQQELSSQRKHFSSNSPCDMDLKGQSGFDLNHLGKEMWPSKMLDQNLLPFFFENIEVCLWPITCHIDCFDVNIKKFLNAIARMFTFLSAFR